MKPTKLPSGAWRCLVHIGTDSAGKNAKQFIQALQGDRSEIPILLALFLGLRRSEIMALEHSDFDPSTHPLTIAKAKVPDKSGKTSSNPQKEKAGNVR